MRRKHPKGDPHPNTRKYRKADVNYGPGKKTERCGICMHYGNRDCTLVAGEIDPTMWCILFE